MPAAPTLTTLTSTAFQPGQPIPKPYTGDGKDVSPPLRWAGLPDGVKEWALICDDPDAPTAEPWVHWVIYKLPPALDGLPEGVSRDAALTVPKGALQGLNSWSTAGYRGPKPPPGHGVHHYHFQLYGLDQPLAAKPGLDKRALLAAMQGHILCKAELVGTYQR